VQINLNICLVFYTLPFVLVLNTKKQSLFVPIY